MPRPEGPSENWDLLSEENCLMEDSIQPPIELVKGQSNTCITKLPYSYLTNSHLHTTPYLSPLKKSPNLLRNDYRHSLEKTLTSKH